MQTSTVDGLFGGIQQESPNKFTADDLIIKEIAAARAVYATLRSQHLQRICFYTEVEGLIAGNPPYDPDELAAAGLQHVANFNDMSPCATFERFHQAYSNLLYNSEYLVNFTLRINDPKATDYARIMSKNWDKVIKKHWPSFDINVASLTAQLVKIGISPILFHDERDPTWRVIEYPKFFVPDQAQSDLDLLATVCVESEFTIQYLWGLYNEFKDKKFQDETSWNTTEIGNLLLWARFSASKQSMSPVDLAELERKLYSGDISFDQMYTDTVRVVSLFQQEYDGAITHQMFHRDWNYSQGVTDKQGSEFLFFERAQYEDLREAFVLFTMNPGAYTIHANRGLGHKIYSLAQAKLMLDCSVVDMARWSSTPIIKSSQLGTKEVEQIKFFPGVPTNVGNADFVQNSLGANVQNVVGAAEYMGRLMNYNLTYSGQDPASPDPSSGSISPSQVRLLAFKEFSVQKNYVLHFYNTFDCVFQNMVAKMLRSKEGYPRYEMAKEWKERCLEDGVPPVVFEIPKSEKNYKLPKHIEVQATRVAGAGSQVALLIGLQELQSIAGSFTASEQQEFKKMFVSATVGPEYLTAFAQPPRPDEARGGSSLAGVENAVMQAGQSPIFSMDNEHREHFTTHYALLRNTVDALSQKQTDVIQANSILRIAVPHTGEHMNALAQNPFAQDFVAMAKPAFDQVMKFAQLIQKNAERATQAQIQEQQQAQENQQRVMSEEELKNFTTMNEEKRKDMKIAAQAQRQTRAGMVKEAALVRKTEADIADKQKKTDADIEIEKQKAGLENDANEDMLEDPGGYLREINGFNKNPLEGIRK